MILATIFLLISAVAIGFYLVYLGLYQRKRLPRLGLIHAALALTAFILLFILIYAGPSSNKLNNIAALFLFFALIGGGIVFALHEEKKPPSMPAVTAHAIMGLIGVSLLIINFI